MDFIEHCFSFQHSVCNSIRYYCLILIIMCFVKVYRIFTECLPNMDRYSVFQQWSQERWMKHCMIFWLTSPHCVLDMVHCMSFQNPSILMDDSLPLCTGVQCVTDRTFFSSLYNPVILVFHFYPFKPKEFKVNNILWNKGSHEVWKCHKNIN